MEGLHLGKVDRLVRSPVREPQVAVTFGEQCIFQISVVQLLWVADPVHEILACRHRSSHHYDVTD